MKTVVKLTVFSLTIAYFAMTAICSAQDVDLEKGLIGYWKLEKDAKDYSGNDNHGKNNGVQFTAKGVNGESAASFNGRDNYISVPNSELLNFGTNDFTLSTWVYTKKHNDDVLGDILSKFDLEKRNGLNFSIMNYSGVTNAQSNHRNVFFGIDDGKIEEKFTDCGRPGNTQFITTLTVFNGDLYASTYEPGINNSGRVYRYNGGTEWADCGSPDKSNTVMSMAVLDGKLYVGTGFYHGQGSALNTDSENTTPGGKIFRYEGGKKWTDCGRPGEHGMVYGWVVEGGGPAKDIWCLTTFNGYLYGSPLISEGIWRYDGDKNWTYVGGPGRRIFGIAVYNGTLYGMGNDVGGIVEYDGVKMWDNAGYQKGATQVYSIAVHNGIMYTGVWPNGTVYRDDGNKKWTSVGQLGNEEEVMGMLVYNGKMYAGTLPLAEVYRYDGGSNWTLLDRLDHTPDVRYRRAWSLAVFNGKLFVGTLPSGHVYSIEAGKSVSYDHELEPGWKHLVAQRNGKNLNFYIDGELKEVSTEFESSDFNLSNSKDLQIGFGTHDYFYGNMSEVRAYNRALTAEEIQSLFKQKSSK